MFCNCISASNWEPQSARFKPNSIGRKYRKERREGTLWAAWIQTQALFFTTMTPCIPAMRHTGTQSKNHHFFSLSINVDCDKGILTMSASLCLILCLFDSSSPLLSLPPLFYLRWIVIMWSKRAPPSPLNEKKGNKKQFCAYETRKEKKEKACVFPSSPTLCPRPNKLLTQNAPGAR